MRLIDLKVKRLGRSQYQESRKIPFVYAHRRHKRLRLGISEFAFVRIAGIAGGFALTRCDRPRHVDLLAQHRRAIKRKRTPGFSMPRQATAERTSDIAETGVAAQELKQFVERVERLEEEKKAISDDIRDVFAEMKGRGFDTKVVRQIIRIRKQDHAERKEMEAILDLYMAALNMT